MRVVFCMMRTTSPILYQKAPCMRSPRTLMSPIFFSKKLDYEIKACSWMVTSTTNLFLAWWSRTNIRNDFWLEGPCTWTRVHVIPRRACSIPANGRHRPQPRRKSCLKASVLSGNTFSVSCHSINHSIPYIKFGANPVSPLLCSGSERAFREEPDSFPRRVPLRWPSRPRTYGT